jgi:hypothetical protein
MWLAAPPAPAAAANADHLTRLPPNMVAFAKQLLRAADRAEHGATRRLFCALTAAFDDVALLVGRVHPRGELALAPNRAIIKSDNGLIALGLGACFTSVRILVHGGGDGGVGVDPDALDCVADTLSVSIFVDPDRLRLGASDDDVGTGDDDADAVNAFAPFELVLGANRRRFRLQHGTMLLSRTGAQMWAVERPADAGSDGNDDVRAARLADHANNHNPNARLLELRFMVSHVQFAALTGTNAISPSAAAWAPPRPPCSAHGLVGRLVIDCEMRHAEAVGMFARFV